MNFIERMKEEMEAQGVTAVELARRVGVEPNTIWSHLRGSHNPADVSKAGVAKALGMDMAEVFPEEESMTVGKWARLHRLRAGLTGQALEEKSGVTAETIYSFEQDRRGTSIFCIIQLADALNIGIDEYIGRRVKSMTGNEYQTLAARTIGAKMSRAKQEMHALHGMASEIGELHGIYQKAYQGHRAEEEHCKKELGDLLWFVAELCTAKNWTMEEVMAMNIQKLMDRYPEGFDEEKSLHRAEGDI